jgi:hypothetical protein
MAGYKAVKTPSPLPQYHIHQRTYNHIISILYRFLKLHTICTLNKLTRQVWDGTYTPNWKEE